MKRLNPFKRVFDQFDKVAIVGGPRCGKTTIARMVKDRTAYHADSLIDTLGWSDISAQLVKEINEHAGPMVVEGTSVVRALRKGAKVDAVILMTQPKTEQTKGQASMGKAVMTIFREWRAAHPDVPVFAEPLGQYSPFETEPDEDSV